MARTNYSSDEATRIYLERLKRTNPSPEVSAVIKEIESELGSEGSTAPPPQSKAKHRALAASR